jgi:hypothetical protein
MRRKNKIKVSGAVIVGLMLVILIVIYIIVSSVMSTVRHMNKSSTTSSSTAKASTSSSPSNKVGEKQSELPSQVLDLTNWKLTLPVNTNHAGDPDEIAQPELATFSDSQHFYVNATNDAVVFRAEAGGITTKGSSYPRSELREMTNDGKSEASWSTDSGTSTMIVREAVTHLPDQKPQVVTAQIHNQTDDVIMIRLESNKLFVEQNGKDAGDLDTNYKLGEIYTVKIVVQSNIAHIYYNNQLKVSVTVSGDQNYFKAGCYTQSNTSKGDKPDAYGEVLIYDLSVSHM